MTMRTKLIVAAVVLVGAVAFLASAGMNSGWVYSMPVDRFLADSQIQGKRVRLEGKVAEEGLVTGAATARFVLLGQSGKVDVAYQGSIPEMFAPGRDVVVEGKLDPKAQLFEANVLLTKCASKYEPGEDGEPMPEGHPPVKQADAAADQNAHVTQVKGSIQ